MRNIITIDPSESYPLYLRCVEYARSVAECKGPSLLTYEERFNAALIAMAFQLGKESR